MRYKVKFLVLSAATVFFCLASSPDAWCGDSAVCVKKSASKKTATHVCPAKKALREKAAPASAPSASANPSGDTLVIIGRLIEIPGKFAPNDLYNYVYIMKYRVMKVVRGSYEGEEILVGHYNPLIPRQRIKDRMAPFARGNVAKFETGAKHRLALITPIERVWNDAVEDEYVDSELDKYYALRADTVK
jgi:hypothetical protein